jgi:hypothetical protein
MEKTTPRKDLYGSWQAGMRYITRDVTIVRELRQLDSELDISWLLHPLARKSE